jgi:hypothetical protein
MERTDETRTYKIIIIIIAILAIIITAYGRSTYQKKWLKDQQYMERHNFITADIQENYALIDFNTTVEHPLGGSYRIYKPYTYAPKILEVDTYEEFMEMASAQNVSKVYITSIDYGSQFHFFSEDMVFAWLFTFTKE